MNTLRWNPYLSFQGDCEEAFAFYARTMGGVVGKVFHYAGSPFADQVPPGWAEKVMHGSLTIGGQLLEGADVKPGDYQRPRGFSLTLHPHGAAEAERIFAALADGGSVLVPLARTFWAERFGMVTDRFGIPWMINCE